MEAIRNVQSECRAIDDDMRWLIALISDTGMRLAKEAGLLKQYLVGLDTGEPYVHVTKHPWLTLKTASSEGKYPWLENPFGLLGGSLRQVGPQTLLFQGTLEHLP